MKRILLASAAVVFSAAMVTSAMAEPAGGWKGFYTGINLGGTWGSSNVRIPAYPANFDISTTSFSFGGQLGYNFQLSDRFILGLEGDVSGMNEAGSHLSGGAGGELFKVRYDLRYSARGRLGYATDNTLYYVTGGWVGTNLSSANFVPPAGVNKSASPSGWTAGAGFDWAWRPHWLIGAEYLHDELGRQAFVFGGPTSVQLTNDTFRLRISYKFGQDDVVAPPPPPPPPPAIAPPPVKTFIVFFDFDKSNLTDKAQEVVAEAVRVAKANGFVKVLVTGHTDTVGSDAYNQALSLRRGQAVRDEMVREGLDGGGIDIVGKSFHDPLVPTGPGVREPQNRRAVIDLGG